MPGTCARAFLSFLVLACGRWGSAAPPWALVVVAVPRYRERPLFCASAPSVPRPSPMHRPWRRRPLACRSFMSVSRASPSGAVPYAGSVWGFCTTRGCDTPATRRQRASCSAKPPSHQIGDRAGRNSRRRRCGVRGIVWARLLTKVPPHQVASSPRRRQGHLSTNFACNSPTVRIDGIACEIAGHRAVCPQKSCT